MARDVDVRSPADWAMAGAAAPDGRPVAAAADFARQDQLQVMAEDISQSLPQGHDIRIASFDAESGNPAVIVSEGGPAVEGDFVRRALDHVQAWVK
jgi:hypothetical protein